MRHPKEVNAYKIIRDIKHVKKLLHWIERLSASQYRIVAGILGVGVGVAGLYFTLQDGEMNYFGSSTAPDVGDFSSYTVAGLQNLGNNCFLNVILQALASTSCFLPFLRNMLDEKSLDENIETMPLLVALMTLLEELSIVQYKRTVLNPRKVMLALNSYVGNFKLTRQQDAAEAFLHLLSSLELELLDSYVPNISSLAEITEFSSRIYKSRVDGQSECERWREHIFGPFDGATGSILTCKSCSYMLSIDFEQFRCLSLSAVLDRSADIMDSCTLDNCLKQFTAVEHLENYKCARCWHMTALKYLSHVQGDNKAKINRIMQCVNFDSCDCKSLFREEEITWTGSSHALKQLVVARCPKILCIHLQRASMNHYGEFIKLEGHISFPFFLDLFPFVKAGTALGQETLVGNMQHYRNDEHLADHVDQLDRQIPEDSVFVDICSDNITRNELQESYNGLSSNPYETVVKEGNSENAVSKNELISSDLNVSQASPRDEPGFDRKASGSDASCPLKSYVYCLSSVVEHYGKYGSGHYAAYRRVASGLNNGSSMGPTGRLIRPWLYVSDHDVSNVSEEDVFAAEASLLFYERLETFP